MSETLSEQVLRVIADFEWIGTQRRLGEMWAMDIATLEAERDKLKAKLGVMEQVVSDIKNAAILAMNEPDIGPQLRPEWVIHRIDTAQEEQVGL
mgnify:CR=1 FL=1